MDNTASTLNDEHVKIDEAKRELERLLGDPRFHVTDRNRAFLQYIADVGLSGQSKGVKAYSVAIDVFGRPCDFDPNTDPIVRIEAARLRASLDQYYEAYASPQQVRISLPRGNYIAEFSRIPSDDDEAADIEAPAQEDKHDEPQVAVPASKDSVPHRGWPIVAGAGSVVVLCLALLGAWSFWSATPPGLTEKPRVMLSTIIRDRRYLDRASNLDDNLLIALSRFGTLRVSMDSLPAHAGQQTRELKVSPAMPPGESQYQVSIKYDFSAGASSATWGITDPRSGETLASGKEQVENGNQSSEQLDAALVSALAIRFGSNLDVLNSLERNRPLPAGTEGNICVLRGEHAINTFDSIALTMARACLEATMEADDNAVDAKAVLARILVLEDELNGTTTNLEQATKISNEVSSIAPASDRGLIARMYIQYTSGQLDSAFATGRTAMARNPLNADIAAALALRLYLSGSFSEGAQIAERTVANLDPSSRAANLVLALDAYSKGNGAQALRRLDNLIDEGSLARCVRIGALARMGKRDEAVTAFEETLVKYPQFPMLMTRIIRTRHLDEGLRAMLERDIATVADDWNSRRRPGK